MTAMAPSLAPQPSYGTVSVVQPGSIAEELGIQPGDQVVSINGHVLRDTIDYRFYAAEERLKIVTLRAGKERVYEVRRDYKRDLGLEFTAPTFDGIRRCQCRCSFCFVQQMPPGLRRTLYIRDDDYRYSFLFGNFVTLTNLTREDWIRLEEQRLSPLYVSVHATDVALRRQILGNPTVPDIMAQLRGLGNLGITVHTQIVLVPGLNDEAALTKSVSDLASLFPIVQSIAIVPVGLTRYHRRGLRSLTPSEAGDLIHRMQPRQARYRRRRGANLVYLSDEIYLLAGHPLPPAEAYDDFPQLENGVGLTRQLLDEWEGIRETAQAIRPGYRKATLVCGTLIAPILQSVIPPLGDAVGVHFEVVPVSNRFFGSSVTVSGLLVGEDVISALRRHELGDLVVLPRAMFDAAGECTLDDWTLDDISRELGVRTAVAGTLEELLHL